MKWPPKKSSEHDGSTTSALLPPHDASSEKLPDTPEAGPITSEAVKHEQEVPSVPCTTVTTSSVLTPTALLPRTRISCKNQADSCTPFKAVAGPCFASGKRRLQLAALASDTNQCGWSDCGRLCTAS